MASWWTDTKISGLYNVRDRHDEIIPWTKKTALELAVICLTNLQVKSYFVEFPQKPENLAVNWDNTSAVMALSELAFGLGCEVRYDPKADCMYVAPHTRILQEVYGDEPFIVTKP